MKGIQNIQQMQGKAIDFRIGKQQDLWGFEMNC